MISFGELFWEKIYSDIYINSGCTPYDIEETAVPCPYPINCRDTALPSPNFG